MNRAGNSRHQETEQRMQEALLALLEQRTLKEITVRELCEIAGVNKATFYRHYQDIYDLALKTERSIHAGLIRLLDTKKKRTLAQPVAEQELEDMIRYIGEYAIFYREYLKTGHDIFLDERFLGLWEEHIKKQFQAIGVQSERRMQYYCRFFQAGIRTIVCNWLETGQQETPEELAKILWQLSSYRLLTKDGDEDLA
ncbi:MAG: TetR/AcrR family transcriptional regulator [Lachnospiraceae bacterium]|nr:TetR/AcrR family transcriptional regulator [Lachnospiraceae bacterium]